MISWSKIELCWSVTKQAFDNRFDFYLTGLYKKSMRRQLENFANALSDYSGEDVDTPKDWHAAIRMLKNYLLGVCRPGKLVVFLDEVPWMETRKSDFVQDNYGDDENFWTNRIDSSMHRAWTGFAFEHLCMNLISQL